MNLENQLSQWSHILIAVAGCAVATSMTNAQSTVYQSGAPVKWSSGLVERSQSMSIAQLRTSITQLAARTEQSRVLVHLKAPPSKSQRQALKAAGLNLTTSLGGTTYFASLDQHANINQLAGSPLASIAPIQLAHKLHPDLQAELVHPWMLSQNAITKSSKLKELADSGVLTVNELKAHDLDPQVVVVVQLHPDVARGAESLRLANTYHAKLLSQAEAINTIVIAVNPDQIKKIAGEDAVMWVEPPLPKLGELNAENRQLTGVNTLNAAPYSLDGSGIDVLVFDAGKVSSHSDFGARLTIGLSDTDSVSDHATHVAGTIGGGGNINTNNRGMAPGVNLISYAFEQEGGLSEGFLYTDPGDLEADYSEAISLYDVDISNNSIGTNTAPNGYPCEWTGNYGTTSALIDSIARGSMGDPFRIIWANGNERQSFRCQGDDNGNHGEFYSTAPPGCAKNHITVGSVDSDTDLSSDFSSWGPTDDGRLKPDISAPGCQDRGDGGVTSTSSFGGYTVKCGTSMAAPTVTGISALILQQYRATFPELNDPMNATLKALLANTAVDRGNVGPDYKYGYGSVRAVPAIDTVLNENLVESEVAQGATYKGIILVGSGESELKVTMAWDDAPAASNVTNSLVNDLDLKIIDSDGMVYLPWTLDPSNPNGSAVQTVEDHLNNIEQVAIQNPAPGAYTVEVSGFNIAAGDTQSFGLVSSSTLVNCSSSGVISIGGSVFTCSGEVTVLVSDCDLNTSDSITDTVDIVIDTDSQSSPSLVLTLTESAPESAQFVGSFLISDTNNRGDITVVPGDTIHATYIDADDGEGGTSVPVVASGSIDCMAPMVDTVSVTNIEPRKADVNIDFDEAVTATVLYGTSMSNQMSSASSGAISSSLTIGLSGLTDNTDYVFVIEAQDRAGNTQIDDNNGNGYAFSTPDIPDFYTEAFPGGIDLEGMQLTLTPADSVDGYTPTMVPLPGGVLPFDPSIGTQLSLNDDDSEFVSIAGGHQIHVYDQSFGSFYIGSNGYITLDGSDSDYSESLDDHFDMVRVSAMFDDLNPLSPGSGKVRWQQLEDRMVISYDGVYEYSGSTPNIFQIEMHFDGVIVISWERIDIDDAIIGISEGNGIDPDFTESDLSTYPAPSDCPADMTGDDELDFFDVSDFLDAFGAKDPVADFDDNGEFDFFDVSAFLDSFAAGCPG